MKLSISNLLKYNGHLGHNIKYQNYKLSRYIYGIINNISVINIEFTLHQLKKVLYLSYDVSSSKGVIDIIDNQISHLTPGFITNNKKYCDILYILDESNKNQASKEAKSRNIPVVSVVDTDNQYSYIDYPIIINNDSTQLRKMIKDSILKSIINGSKNESLIFKYNYIIRD